PSNAGVSGARGRRKFPGAGGAGWVVCWAAAVVAVAARSAPKFRRVRNSGLVGSLVMIVRQKRSLVDQDLLIIEFPLGYFSHMVQTTSRESACSSDFNAIVDFHQRHGLWNEGGRPMLTITR